MSGSLTEQGARRFALVRVNLSDMSCGSDLALLLTFEVHLLFFPRFPCRKAEQLPRSINRTVILKKAELGLVLALPI